MVEKGNQTFAHNDEERQRQAATEGGHASHEKGTAHEFSDRKGADAGRRGGPGHSPVHASQEEANEQSAEEADRSNDPDSSESASSHSRKTRGGTHDQHVTAGKKGGSRIRELIELGYKYEEEHGIGPGRNERSKLAAKRKSGKEGDDESEEDRA